MTLFTPCGLLRKLPPPQLENILLATNGPCPRILLGDFGLARVADTRFTSILGTFTYLSPEALTCYTTKAGKCRKHLGQLVHPLTLDIFQATTGRKLIAGQSEYAYT